MAHDVFLSYSSKDKLAADAACAVLERNEIRVWMAPRDVLPGPGWAKSIIEAISGARVMVLVFSGSANTSPQIEREVERAISKGLTVIPFRIEDIEPSGAMEYFINASHWLDAFTKPLEQHLDRLADVVRRVMESQYGEVRPSASAGVRPGNERCEPEQAGVAGQAEALIPEGRRADTSILSQARPQRRKLGLLAFDAAVVVSLVALGGYVWLDIQRVGADSRSAAS
jgi:hypothetical protein